MASRGVTPNTAHANHGTCYGRSMGDVGAKDVGAKVQIKVMLTRKQLARVNEIAERERAAAENVEPNRSAVIRRFVREGIEREARDDRT